MAAKYGIERKWRFPRNWSNDELRRFAPLVGGDVVNVSAWRDEDKQAGHYRDYFTAAQTYSLTNWHGERGSQNSAGELLINLEEPLPQEFENRFDVVFNHTTLEHVFNVFTAFESLARLSRDLIILVVPCQQELHYNSGFGDYWRFTPLSLRKLCEINGLMPIYESASPDIENASIYLFLVASKHPDRWRGKLPEQKLPDVFLGQNLVRNDPFTLFTTWCYSKLKNMNWYKRQSKKFIKRHFREGEE